MIILAIDPGPERSGWVVYGQDPGRGRVIAAGNEGNDRLVTVLMRHYASAHTCAIEWPLPWQKMRPELAETIAWIGRFEQQWRALWGRYPERVGRHDVVRHLVPVGLQGNRDAAVRAALIDRFGGTKKVAVGTKKQPGPLYGVSKHAWAALAVAVTWADQQEGHHGG